MGLNDASNGIKTPCIVSICCLAYNHERFIRKCLDSFLNQKTNFAFEILIHDDASSDNTATIIKEYQVRYPDIVLPLYQSENQYSLGVPVTPTFNWSRARGKYIAMCEGDDYWTDDFKLQKQFDFMENNESFSCCGHLSEVVYDYDCDLKNESFSTLNGHSGIISKRNFLMLNNFHTSSMFFRSRLIYDYPVHKRVLVRDRPLKIWLLSRGLIKILPEKMSVYRRNRGGVSENITVREMYEAELATARALRNEVTGLNLQIEYLISHWHYYFLCNEVNLKLTDRIRLFYNFILGSFYVFPRNMKQIAVGIIRIFGWTMTSVKKK